MRFTSSYNRNMRDRYTYSTILVHFGTYKDGLHIKSLYTVLPLLLIVGVFTD